MKRWRHLGVGIGLVVCILIPAQRALADLVFVGVVDLHGTGFGNVTTILTMQGLPANELTSLESGCVGVNGAGNTATGPSECEGTNVGGDEKPGVVHNSTPLVSDASQISIIFNADEPSGESITLDNLVMSLSNNNGFVGFESGDLLAPIPFPETFEGIGKAGFEFRLSADQAAEANAAIAAGFNRLGLSATATEARAGPDTFFLFQFPDQEVPEPSAFFMLGLNLIFLAAVARRRPLRLGFG